MTTKNCANGPKLVLKDLCEKSFVRNVRLPVGDKPEQWVLKEGWLKSLTKDLKMNELQKLKKIFSLSVLGGKDKSTQVWVIANVHSTKGYIKISEEINHKLLTPNNTYVVKKVQEQED